MTAVPILAVIFTFVIILNVLENSSKERNRKIEAALRMREMELGYPREPTPLRSGRKSFPTRMLKKRLEKHMNSMPPKAAPGLRWSKGSSTLKSVSTIWKKSYGVERTPTTRNKE